ncbi:MAG: hypothetical protein LBS74_07270 [Oscillospiraceae bacterium]|jgi:hypothetical protein|nr:hypothetical protein [Oscillospiraceae bacterium]
MLAVFERIESPKRSWLKNKFLDIFAPSPEGVLELIEDVPYIRISCEERRGKLPWNRISEISLDCARRVLMPKDIFPPEGSGLKRFTPSEFPKITLEKLAVTALLQAEAEPSTIKLAICANAADVKRLLPLVLNCASEIRIISKDIEALELFTEDTAELSGAAIMLTDDPKAVDSCNLIIAPSGLPEGAKGNNKAIVFASGRRDFEGIQILSAEVEIPEWLRPAYKPIYDRGEFLAAFYEIANARRLADLAPTQAIGRSGSITPEQLAQVIKSI